jgi:hypothetical protein
LILNTSSRVSSEMDGRLPPQLIENSTRSHPISTYSSHPLFDSNSPDRAQSAGVGVSAILDHLFHTILDAGDGVLILNPYYAGFDRDLVGGRSGVKLVGVDWAGYGDQTECQNEDEVQDEWAGDGGLEEAFEKALQNARADGVDVSRRSGLRRFMPITNANLTSYPTIFAQLYAHDYVRSERS